MGQWHTVGSVDDVDEDQPMAATVDDTKIGVFKVAGELYAMEDVCPHAFALLSQGFVDGDTVECPLHEAVFHIPTGKCLKEPGGRDLCTYKVRLAGHEIQVLVNGAA